MRDLVFKNLTSNNRRMKIIASAESVERDGLRHVINRHFLYTVKELHEGRVSAKFHPSLIVRKQRITALHSEMFFCKLKGSVYVVNNDRMFLVDYMHTLKINVTTLPGHLTHIEGECR